MSDARKVTIRDVAASAGVSRYCGAPTSTDPHAPFDRPFHLILNLAIGGHLPEGRNLGSVSLAGYPRSMQVDWVRVWQRQDELASPDRSKGAEWDGDAKR